MCLSITLQAMQWGLGQRPGIAVQVADLPGVGSTHGFPLRQASGIAEQPGQPANSALQAYACF